MNSDQTTSVIRSLLKVGGAYLAARGWGDSGTWEIVSGGVLALAGIVWSHFTHKTAGPAATS